MTYSFGKITIFKYLYIRYYYEKYRDYTNRKIIKLYKI